MNKTYLRPLGLVYGPDALTMFASCDAVPLGGMAAIGFTHVEVISRLDRKIERHVEPVAALRGDARLDKITKARTSFAGIDLSQTRLMGIVNVTPDSFSDGGVNLDPSAAIAHGHQLAEDGAGVLDIGGESTRPGSDTVIDEDEAQRILPVIRGLTNYVVSADTRKSVVMREALAAGAKIINDVSALAHDPKSAGVIAGAKCPVILMHAQGEPKTMQLSPKYENVALDVYDALEARIAAAVAAGIAKDRIMVDPGIGFGKTYRHNLEIMQQLTLFHGLGVPLLIGLSRKSLIGALTGEKQAARRISGSIGGALQAAMQGAHMLRVHDVKDTAAALSVFTASLNPDSVEF